ncbi:MAG: alpha/beta hydrolase, partial [Ferruginibacter sp.]
QNSTLTLYPSTPGAKVSVTFNSFRTQTQYRDAANINIFDDDILYVYNGNSTAATQIEALQGLAENKTIISTAADGSLTFKFVSHTPHPNYTPPSGSRAGWSAFFYCGTLTAPVVNSITFTNDIKNHKGFEPYPLYSGSATVTNNPMKICADGSTATYIKVNVSNTTGINFKILDDANNVVTDAVNNTATDPGKFGRLGIPYTFGGNVEVAYTHPQYMDRSGVSRPLKIKVYYGENEISGIDFPLDIYRAPIVFVHGFCGDRTTFKIMEDLLLNNSLYPQLPNSPLIHRIGYQMTSFFSFMTNRKKVQNGIDEVLKKARIANYSAGKIILIGHSMGGILSRLYLQGTYSDYRYDISKLITANTPHYGTQFANNVLTALPYLRTAIAILAPPAVGSIFNTITSQNSPFLGAIKDMRVNSSPIMYNLNKSQSGQAKVPSVTLSTDQIGDNNAFAIAIRSLLHIVPNIYNGETNDLIVPLTSQQSGIALEPTVPHQWHVGAGQNVTIMSQIRDLINADPSANLFTMGGFPTNKLQVPSINQSSNQNIAKKLQTIDSIKIINPTPGQAFNPNDNVNVDIYYNGNITQMALIAYGNSITPITIDTVNVSHLIFKIPGNAVGTLHVVLLAGNSTSWLAQDTTNIQVTSTNIADSIVINPTVVNLPLGLSENITVNGYFNGTHDSVNIIGASGLTVQYDPAFLSYDGEGTFKGINIGATYIIYKYQSHSDTAYVSVYNDSSVLTASFDYSSQNICTNNSVTFQDQSLGLAVSHQWSFPGGNPSMSTLSNPVVSYSTPGYYSASLKTTFTNGVDSILIDSLIHVGSPNTTISSGNWNDPSIWSCSSVPSLNDSVVVASGHVVTLNNSSQIRKLYVENGGSILLNDTSVLFAIGSNLDKTSPVICDGSMIINNGKMKIYGNLNLTGASVFNMAGGNLIIDGNTGQISTSIPDGQHLFNAYSDAGNFLFSGGALQFINPPLGENSQAINCSNNFDPQSTVIFGDGLSTVASNNPNGFGGNLLPGQIGKMILDAATIGNNRVFKNLSPLIIKISCDVKSGKLIQGALLQINN